LSCLNTHNTLTQDDLDTMDPELLELICNKHLERMEKDRDIDYLPTNRKFCRACHHFMEPLIIARYIFNKMARDKFIKLIHTPYKYINFLTVITFDAFKEFVTLIAISGQTYKRDRIVIET